MLKAKINANNVNASDGYFGQLDLSIDAKTLSVINMTQYKLKCR